MIYLDGGDAGFVLNIPTPEISVGADYLFGCYNGINGESINGGGKGFSTIHIDVGYTFLLFRK